MRRARREEPKNPKDMKPQDLTRFTQDKETKKTKILKSCVNLVLILWLNGCLLFMQGCATAPVSSEARAKDIKPLQSVSASALRFQDIPAPAGFKLAPKESFVFENNFVRFALLRYIGRADAARVVRFYKDEMPGYGWNPVNIIEHDTRFLNFDKDDQTCVVTIDSSATRTSVNIAVAPKSIKKGLDK